MMNIIGALVHTVDNAVSVEYFGAIGVAVVAVVKKYWGRPSWCRRWEGEEKLRRWLKKEGACKLIIFDV
jgi:hypothetical protein